MNYNAIIMEAKREWEQAYLNGDQAGMKQATPKPKRLENRQDRQTVFQVSQATCRMVLT